MGYFRKGYFILCSSPIFSIAVYLIVTSLFYRTDLGQTSLIWYQISIIGVQLCGIILCLLGYGRRESVQSHILLNMFLVLYGSYGVWLLSFSYFEFIRKTHWPGVGEPSMWDYVLYGVWTVKEVVWIVSGLVFAVISIWRRIKTGSPRRITDD